VLGTPEGSLEGAPLGAADLVTLGFGEGRLDGAPELMVGTLLGNDDGMFDGELLGSSLAADGLLDGCVEGLLVGPEVGLLDGADVSGSGCDETLKYSSENAPSNVLIPRKSAARTPA